MALEASPFLRGIRLPLDPISFNLGHSGGSFESGRPGRRGAIPLGDYPEEGDWPGRRGLTLFLLSLPSLSPSILARVGGA